MQPALRGIVYILISNFAFCTMACLTKYASFCSAYTSALYRCITGMGVIGILALSGRTRLTFNNKNGLFFRGLFGGIAICTGFLSISKLGLVKASVIVNTYPIFATIFSFILLKEKISMVKIISIIGSFAGMLLIIVQKNGSDNNLFSIGIYELISITGSLLGGLALVYVKKLQETESSATILFSQCLMGFWIVLIPAANTSVSAASMHNTMILLGIGLLACAGQLIFTEGYRYISVATGSILVMLSPVINFLAGAVLFHEQVSFTTFLGAFITIGSCAVILFSNQKTEECIDK